MPRHFILAVGALVLFGSAYAQQVAVTEWPVVRRILDDAEKEVRRNRKEYEEANAKTVAEARKALQSEVDRLLDAKKAEEAVALRQLVASFKDEVIRNAEADKQAKPRLPTYVGRWLNDSENLLRIINPDGSYVQYGRDGAVAVRGTWKALDEGGCVINRSDRKRIKVWVVNDSIVAAQWFGANGVAEGDGAIYFRQ